MIFLIDWEIFKIRYLKSNTIFVKEYEDQWCFYTYDGYTKIKSIKEKDIDTEKNISFVDKYMTDKQNLIKIIDIVDYETQEEEKINEYDDEEFEVNLEDG